MRKRKRKRKIIDGCYLKRNIIGEERNQEGEKLELEKRMHAKPTESKREKLARDRERKKDRKERLKG